MRIGRFLSCEELGPAELVEQAEHAEEAGFRALWISDRYRTCDDEQGPGAPSWPVIGAVMEATDLPTTTAVTRPTPVQQIGHEQDAFSTRRASGILPRSS